VSENIYSNPSGFTEIPWEFSVEYFAGLAIGVIQAKESELNVVKPNTNSTGKPLECEFCGSRLKLNATACVACMKPTKTRNKTFSDTHEPRVLLAEEDYHLLTCDPAQLQSLDQSELVRIHNISVDALRRACQRLLAAGEQPVKVREGLVVPREWDAHYCNLWPIQPKYLIWMAARHAVLGNPLKGEVFEWNNVGAQQTKSSTGGKIAGAAAIGVLAGFLFG